MINHSNEKIEKQRRPSMLHLHLHRPASLEGVARADDESEVVRSQLGIGGGRVGVGEAGGRQDRAALDAGLEALLLQG